MATFIIGFCLGLVIGVGMMGIMTSKSIDSRREEYEEVIREVLKEVERLKHKEE